MNDHQKMKRRKVDSAILADIVDRIVKLAKPEKIILFGSGARDQMRCNSDVDLLVVKSGRFDRGRLVEKIYMAMEGVGEPVDVIMVTPEEVQQYADTPWLVISPALKEGRVIYAA